MHSKRDENPTGSLAAAAASKGKKALPSSSNAAAAAAVEEDSEIATADKSQNVDIQTLWEI